MSQVESVSGVNAPQAVLEFAKKMSAAQGCKVKITKERSGYHLYMPCPDCLETHGKRELSDPKYSINLTKHLGLLDDDTDLMFQDWTEIENTRERRSGVCQRTRSQAKPHMFCVSDLLRMSTVTQRHPDIMTAASVAFDGDASERESHWEPDSITGVLCPPPPGTIKLLKDLPADHPARYYIEQRGFNVDVLHDMFRVAWCEREYPYGQNGIYYRRMPGQWKDTPQGRIIFHGLVENTPVIWQGRVLEAVSEDGLAHYYWHPYQQRWDLIETRAHNKAAWMRQPPFNEVNEEQRYEWQPSKYKTAKYGNRFVAGWDAAIRESRNSDYSWCCICEGPLDAGRVGPGGLAVFGSSLPADAAKKIVENFQIVITAFDNDAAGVAATNTVHRQLNAVSARNPAMMELAQMQIPSGKDLGEMKQDVADELLQLTLNRIKRNL